MVPAGTPAVPLDLRQVIIIITIIAIIVIIIITDIVIVTLYYYTLLLIFSLSSWRQINEDIRTDWYPVERIGEDIREFAK